MIHEEHEGSRSINCSANKPLAFKLAFTPEIEKQPYS
jgi:hypothetical protein